MGMFKKECAQMLVCTQADFSALPGRLHHAAMIFRENELPFTPNTPDNISQSASHVPGHEGRRERPGRVRADETQRLHDEVKLMFSSERTTTICKTSNNTRHALERGECCVQGQW